jgi:hypothetical protein
MWKKDRLVKYILLIKEIEIESYILSIKIKSLFSNTGITNKILCQN